jgi:hypothetical protein
VLYHASDTPFRVRPEKPLLFTTVCPVDWEPQEGEYVTRIELLRSVVLFYMIGEFHNTRVRPVLDVLIGKPGYNLNKQNEFANHCYQGYLKRDGFDGWITSVEGKQPVEIALINDPTLWRAHGESVEVGPDITGNYNKNTETPNHRWRDFPMRVVDPVFRVNQHWRPEIEGYLADCERRRCLGCCTLARMFLAAGGVQYFEAPIGNVAWYC